MVHRDLHRHPRRAYTGPPLPPHHLPVDQYEATATATTTMAKRPGPDCYGYFDWYSFGSNDPVSSCLSAKKHPLPFALGSDSDSSLLLSLSTCDWCKEHWKKPRYGCHLVVVLVGERIDGVACESIHVHNGDDVCDECVAIVPPCERMVPWQ